MTLSNIFSTFFGYTFKTYGENKGDHPPISDALLTWATAVGQGLVNGFARIGFGLSLDYFSFKVMFSILMSIQLVNALIVYHAVYYPWLYVTCCFVNNMCIAGSLSGIPIAVVNVFGLERGPGVLSFVDLGILFASMFNVILTVYLMDYVNL